MLGVDQNATWEVIYLRFTHTHAHTFNTNFITFSLQRLSTIEGQLPWEVLHEVKDSIASNLPVQKWNNSS